jgi:hypothetical protein
MAVEHTVFPPAALEDGEEVAKWLEMVITSEHNFLVLFCHREVLVGADEANLGLCFEAFHEHDILGV